MSDSSQQVIARIRAENSALFAPGSAEERALSLASTLVSQNNIETAHSIIVNLSIPEEVKSQIITSFSDNVQTPSVSGIPKPPAPPVEKMISSATPTVVRGSVSLPKVEGGSLFTKRINENKALLENVVAAKNTPKTDYIIPSVIKTYEVPKDEEIQREKVEKMRLDRELAQATKMFQHMDSYMQKAYTSGDPHLIASAERQLASLLERYPVYSQKKADHVEKLRSMKNISTQSVGSETSDEVLPPPVEREWPNAKGEVVYQPAESYNPPSSFDVVPATQAEYEILPQLEMNGITLHAGMTITSEKDVYRLQEIRKDVQNDSEGIISISFQGITTGNHFLVPLAELQNALEQQDLDPDSFFNSHRI